MMTVNEVSKRTGVSSMDFSVFDTSKIDEYSKRAKEQWGKTDAYQEYKEKFRNRYENCRRISRNIFTIAPMKS